jgi:Tol biopolymer transport system component
MSMNALGRCFLIAASAASAACTANVQPEPDALTTRAWSGSPDFISGDISPDGRYLSQVNWASGDIQLVDLRSGEARDLTGQGYSGGYAWTSAFSPDAQRIAVAWYVDSVNAHELRVMSTDNGHFRTVVPADRDRYYIDPVDWSASGDEILVAVQGKEQTWQLGLVPAAGGPMRTVKAFGWQTPGGGHDQAYPDADLSPDGRYVGYDYPPNPTAATRDIFVVPSTGGPERVLVSGPGSDRLLGWLPSGEGILFYSDRSGTPSIWRLRVRDGRPVGEPELIHAKVRALVPLGFTRDGYAYGVTTETVRLHTAEVDRAGGESAGIRRAADEPVWRKSYVGDWSPDGAHLAFVAHDPLPDPAETLQIVSSSGEIVRTIVLTPALHTSNGTLRWPAKDRIIVFAYERGVDGIFVVDLRDGSHRRVVTPPTVGRRGIKWFDVGPDGRSLYMIGRPQGQGRGNDLAALDAETGAVRVIGNARAVPASLSVSPDGSQLAFLARGDSSARVELRVIPTTAGGFSRTVYRPDRGRLAPPVTWMPDGSRLVFRLENGDQSSLWSISVRGGEPLRLLSDCCAENYVRIHPDGKRIALASGRDRGEVWILKVP